MDNNVGVSLLVENVQELASKNSKEIPHRYIRSALIPADEVSVNDSWQIPVIDMSKVNSHEYQTEMSKLHQACKDWGFFQLTNHGATTAIENMNAATHEFFKLPLEEKMVYSQQPGSFEGYGQASFNLEDQKLDWNDRLFIYTIPASARKMRFWPTNPTSFRSSLEEYSRELQKICIRLLELMAVNLGVESKEFVSMCQECTQSIRIACYPPCSQPDKVLGITPHSDPVLLTLLVQVNEVEGLQIRKNGKWVPVKPLPGAIIVNTGDAMEVMTKLVFHIGLKNVQELASKNLKEIPHRFIRSEIRTDDVSVNESSQIPVIDMCKLVAGNAEYETEMSKLHQACKD
ncbi:OLC1v1031405C1 [Oldenlandia corymbosa var. corymbosa]|uniref:OLC1v1031405C1 n=1 Tax=Oldenlandia corymbosa var. corymbosa TaxID=529605 RepID=A0AAV1CJC2_OLDCO|nr:OLC1v1031405C1 [Oldenlandia corymbosa var. corymbosa]